MGVSGAEVLSWHGPRRFPPSWASNATGEARGASRMIQDPGLKFTPGVPERGFLGALESEKFSGCSGHPWCNLLGFCSSRKGSSLVPLL